MKLDLRLQLCRQLRNLRVQRQKGAAAFFAFNSGRNLRPP
jgi:hypothetical protein